MSRPADYKRQPICKDCYYSDLSFYPGSEDYGNEWSCEKHKCPVDNNGHCRDYEDAFDGRRPMTKHNSTFIIVGIICLAVVTFLSIVKCADNKANVLWPEGRAITR